MSCQWNDSEMFSDQYVTHMHATFKKSQKFSIMNNHNFNFNRLCETDCFGTTMLNNIIV